MTAFTTQSPAAAPASAPAAKPHDLPLEGLRGFAALMVLYCHYFAPATDLDPRYAPSAAFWWLEAGHGAVALFFVISGYVIGLTNAEPWSGRRGRDYLWRRFVRLVPLYVLAIAASVALRPVDSPGTIVGNLFFLQNVQPYGAWEVPLLLANTNLWSLNFEVVYYLAFLAIWRWRIGVAGLLGCSVGITAAGYLAPGTLPPVLVSYAAGWVFWLAGLWLAWHGGPANQAATREPWPALLLLLVVAWKMKVLFAVLLRFGFAEHAQPGLLSLLNLDYVPVCAVLVALVTGRRPRGYVVVRNACLGVLIGFCVWRMARGTFWNEPSMQINGALTALAAAAWWWRPSLAFFQRIAWTGFLCYGIYIFQRPAQWLVRDHFDWVSGSPLTFGVRVVVVLGLTFLFAWVAERRIQPWVRAKLERMRRSAAAPAPAAATVPPTP